MISRRLLIPALGAAALLVAGLVWSLVSDHSNPAGPGDIFEGKQTAASQASVPGAAGQTVGAPASAPPAPDLEEMQRAAALSAGGTAGQELAERMSQTSAEAGRRAAEDPKAALAWALEQGEVTRRALDAVLGAWGRADPAGAFEALRWTEAKEGSNDRIYGLSVLVGQWVAKDPSAVWKAVGTLPDSLDSAMLKSQVVGAWMEKDPAAAAAALKALSGGGRGKEEQQFLQSSFATVANRLAVQNGAKAAEWALGFAEGSAERASAVTGVVTGWYAKDAKAVSGWLNSMEDGVVHDMGAAALVSLCMESAPEVSLQWAQAISNEAQRSLLTQNVASRWFSEDPKKAEAWVQNSDLLSADQRDTILKSFGTVRDLIGVGQSK